MRDARSGLVLGDAAGGIFFRSLRASVPVGEQHERVSLCCSASGVSRLISEAQEYAQRNPNFLCPPSPSLSPAPLNSVLFLSSTIRCSQVPEGRIARPPPPRDGVALPDDQDNARYLGGAADAALVPVHFGDRPGLRGGHRVPQVFLIRGPGKGARVLASLL